MKKIIVSLTLISWLLFLFNAESYAANPYVCWTNRLTGKVTTPDALNTVVVISLAWPATQTITATVAPDWSYEALFDSAVVTDGLYTVTSTATYSWVSAEWTSTVMIWNECGVCGNDVIDWLETCEQDSDCTQWQVCWWCTCLDNDDMKELIQGYAQEVADYYQHVAPQVLPARFVDTWPFAFVDSAIEKVWIKFAWGWKTAVYNTVPDWTIDPMIDTNTLAFDAVYWSLPSMYRNKDVYL